MSRRLLPALRCAVVVVGLASVATGAHAGPIIPGALIGTNFVGQITQYSTAGAVLDIFTVTGMANTAVGLAYIGGTVYINDVANRVYSVNPLTGAATFLFNTGAPSQDEGLGSFGSDLLVVGTSGSVRRFTTGGTLLGSFAGGSGDRGVDGDGTNVYVGTVSGNALNTYSIAGALLGSFALPSFPSSVAYDVDTNSLWVGFGFSDLFVRNYSLTGTLLGAFSAGVATGSGNGLEYIPNTSIVPEPASLLLLGFGLVGLRARRKRLA